MKYQINLNNNFCSFKDSFSREIDKSSHHRNYSDFSGAFLSEAKFSLYKDLNSLKINEKVIDFHPDVGMKILHSKRPIEIKCETATTSFNTNNKTKFIGGHQSQTVTNSKNKNYLTKIKIPFKSYSNFLQPGDDKSQEVRKEDFILPEIKNKLDKRLPGQVKIKKELINKLCGKFINNQEKRNDSIYRTNDKSNSKFLDYSPKKNKSLVNYLNLRSMHLHRSKDYKTHPDFTHLELEQSEYKKVNQVPKDILRISPKIKNLKNTFRPLDKSKINNLIKTQINSNSNSSMGNKIESKSLETIQNTVPHLRRGINEINPTDFETGSEYLNHLQRNVQINFKRKFPQYKRIKEYDSQIKMNEVISSPDYKNGSRLGLIMKKPYFHINRNISFSQLLNDKQVLFKIHNKNMKSFKDSENELKFFNSNN
jgi:hypothetical protein